MSNPQAKLLVFWFLFCFFFNMHFSRMLLCLSIISLAFSDLECLWGTGGLYGIKELLLYS